MNRLKCFNCEKVAHISIKTVISCPGKFYQKALFDLKKMITYYPINDINREKNDYQTGSFLELDKKIHQLIELLKKTRVHSMTVRKYRAIN
jgi:hypothetical protein